MPAKKIIPVAVFGILLAACASNDRDLSMEELQFCREACPGYGCPDWCPHESIAD